MIPETELQKISTLYDGLVISSQGVMTDNDRMLLDEAFRFSGELYGDSRHLTGELMIIHSLSIASLITLPKFIMYFTVELLLQFLTDLRYTAYFEMKV